MISNPSSNKDVNESGRAASDRQVALALGLFVLAIYLTTIAMHFQSIDEVATYSATRSLIGRGTFDADILSWLQPLMGRNAVVATAANGHTYSVKDVGPSILTVPLVAAARLMGASPIRAVFLFSPIVTAITVGLFYHVIRSWNYPRLSAVLGALTYGLGTMAWPYTKTLFTQPLAALGLLIAIWGVTYGQDHGRKLMTFIAGAGMGLAGVSAVPTWITLPIYLLYLVAWESLSKSSWRTELKQAIGLSALFLLGVVPFTILQAGYNWLRFGSLLQTGYQLLGTADFNPQYFGVASFGQLLSTPRGIIWYAPVTLLAPIGLWMSWKTGRVRLLILAFGQALFVFGVYSVYYFWWGGGSYGPRFMMAVMPAMTLLTVPLIDHAVNNNAHRWVRMTVGSLLAISVATQALGSIVDIYASYGRMYDGLEKLTPPPSFFVDAPVLTELAWVPQIIFPKLIEKGQLDLLILATGSPDWLLLAAQLALVVVAGLFLISLIRLASKAITRWGLAALTGLIVGLIIFVLLRYPRAYGFSKIAMPPLAGFDELNTAVSEAVSPDDGLVVMLYSPASDAWLDRNDGRVHDIGLTIESPLREETVQKLEHIPIWHRRVWLITNAVVTGDPANGVEYWFAQRAYAGSVQWIEGFRLVPYTFATDIGTLHPLSHSFKDREIALSGYALEYVDSSTSSWLTVWLRWEALGVPSENYSAFVHVLDSNGNLIAQQDGWPVGGYSPTSGWQPGQIIDDRRAVLLPETLTAGDYIVRVGLYVTVSGEPLLVDGTGEPFVTLATVRLGR